MDALDLSGPLVLKFMLDITMDIDDSAPRELTQSLQVLRLKNIPGESV